MSAPSISFKTAPLGECIRDDLETAALLDKEAFK